MKRYQLGRDYINFIYGFAMKGLREGYGHRRPKNTGWPYEKQGGGAIFKERMRREVKTGKSK